LLVETANELDDVGEQDRRAIFGALAKALAAVERRPATEDSSEGEETPSEQKASLRSKGVCEPRERQWELARPTVRYPVKRAA
jgi:hypothetical protein